MADLPPGAAPSFGDHEPGTAQELAPLVLSEAAHRSMAATGPLADLSGEFHLENPAIEGHLVVEPSATPGMVHIRADLAHGRGGGLHYDAEVRESWLVREGSPEAPGDSRARIARALADLASLPHQSTVTVSLEG